MRRHALALAGLALAGCAVGPNYERPQIPLPAEFYGEQAAAEAQSLADLPWWEVFDDPVLKDLIGEALKNGYDARLAAARVEEARARYGIARSDLFPQAGYTAGWTRERQDQFFNPDGNTDTKWTAKLGFAWELDLWGRIRRSNEAALARYLATEEARRGVLLSLASDVAITYFELRALDAELEIARRTSDAFQDTYDLFSRRLDGGAASALETSRAEASLGQVAALVPELERAIVARENHLNFLLGRSPRPIPRDAPLPRLPPAVPPGLPATLLERRPDVRQAEQELVAANANIGVAKAAFFPTLSLTGMFGNVSPELGELFSQGKTWNIAANLLGPLFTGGSLKRNLAVTRAQWEQSKILYESAVTNALGEVSTALVSRARLVETERQRERAVAAYREAVRLANLRYVSGLSAYFEVLESQQQLFPAEILLAQTRRNQLIAVVDLYRALGGGWKAEALNQAAAHP